jgi:hypothetical protein
MIFAKYILALLLAVNCQAQFIPMISHTAGATNVTLVKMLPEVYLTNGLISHWKLDEASGVRYDSWGTNHLQTQGTVNQEGGIINSGAGNSGVTGKLTNSFGANLNLSSFSVSYWFSNAVNTTLYVALNGTNSSSYNWYIYHTTTQVRFFAGSSHFATAFGSVSGTYHVVWTYSGSSTTAVCYVNGTQVYSGVGTAC